MTPLEKQVEELLEELCASGMYSETDEAELGPVPSKLKWHNYLLVVKELKMSKYMWKFLNKNGRSIVSEHGNLKWKVGQWQHCDGEMKACKNGLHASNKIYEAFSYVQGSVLAKVEVKGKHHDEKDKSAYSDMRIVEAYKWTKKDSVALAIFSAELCLKQFEKLYPDDKRPREAIETARAVLAHDTASNRAAARSAAEAAWAAWSAAEAAWAAWAAWSAWAAAEAAWAARSAAEAAWAAWSAWAARSAARSAWAAEAAGSHTLNKIEKWFNNHLKELEKIK